MNNRNIFQKNAPLKAVFGISTLQDQTELVNQYHQQGRNQNPKPPIIVIQDQDNGKINGVPFNFHNITAKEAYTKYGAGFFKNSDGSFGFKAGSAKGTITGNTNQVSAYVKNGKLVIETSDKGYIDQDNSPNVSYIIIPPKNSKESLSASSVKKINGVIINYNGILESDTKRDYGLNIDKVDDKTLKLDLQGEPHLDQGNAESIKLYEQKSGGTTQLMVAIANKDNSTQFFALDRKKR